MCFLFLLTSLSLPLNPTPFLALQGTETVSPDSSSVTCLQGQMEEENPSPVPSLSHGKKYFQDWAQLSRINLILLDFGIQSHQSPVRAFRVPYHQTIGTNPFPRVGLREVCVPLCAFADLAKQGLFSPCACSQGTEIAWHCMTRPQENCVSLGDAQCPQPDH